MPSLRDLGTAARNPGAVALAATGVGTLALAGVFLAGYGGTIVLAAGVFFVLALGVQAFRLVRAFATSAGVDSTDASGASGAGTDATRRFLVRIVTVAIVCALALGACAVTFGRERGPALAFGALAAAAWLAAATILARFDDVVRGAERARRANRKRRPPT